MMPKMGPYVVSKQIVSYNFYRFKTQYLVQRITSGAAVVCPRSNHSVIALTLDQVSHLLNSVLIKKLIVFICVDVN